MNKDEGLKTHLNHPHNLISNLNLKALKKSEKKFSKIFKKYLRAPLAVLLLLGVAGAVFVKFDTSAAANITDQYLRPIFGGRPVMFFEGLFFNASDSASKIVYDFKKPISPQFIASAPDQSVSDTMDLTPIPPNSLLSPLAGEGVWNPIALNVFPAQTVMAYTFVRPDSSRSFAIVSVVKMDMTQLTIGSVAGIAEPGGEVGKRGPGKVPKAIVQSGGLVAAFDGGFQYRDGAYGMIVGDTTYLPLKNNLGTIVGYANGNIKIIDYTGQDLGSNIVFIRQNSPMLIKNGNIVVTNLGSTETWGRVVGAGMYTWRSGIGITQNGQLLFAAGNDLSPQTLAQALQLAGAVNAIQLDINPNWVRFNIFESNSNGTYNSTPLNKDMADGAKSYLNGYQKDFFYIYKK
jgi:hypothetical protein